MTGEKKKKIIGTISLAGCFGCHMSLLDIDLLLLDLIKLVEFNRSPFTDIKRFTKRCDIGLIEGGCCNEENVEVLKDFRKNCDTLVVMGECSITGGLPALRNNIPLQECLEESYRRVPTSHGEQIIPKDKELPILLPQVIPCHEVVKIDYALPGCPPHADLISKTLLGLVTGEMEEIPYEIFKYD